MLRTRQLALASLVGLILLGRAARVEGVPIFEPNNSAGTATILANGQLIVSDSLDATLGRPATILGHYNPAYSTLHAINETGDPEVDGFANQLVDVPLEPNGSAYFRVTGADDVNFTGTHLQMGQYYVQFDLYDSSHDFFQTLSLEFDSVIPGFIDNIWINPPESPEPQRIGGTVTATVHNIVGPGEGDSVDYFLFTGLGDNQAFTAVLSGTTFNARLGWFGDPSNTLLASSDGPTAMLFGTADGNGRALLAVTGVGDTNFGGVHAQQGDYTLTVIVPEPSSVLLLAFGGSTVGLVLLRRVRRRLQVERLRSNRRHIG